MGNNINLLSALDKLCVFKTSKNSDNTELKNYCKEKRGKVVVGDVKNTSYAINKEYAETFTQKLVTYGIFDNDPEVIDRNEAIKMGYKFETLDNFDR